MGQVQRGRRSRAAPIAAPRAMPQRGKVKPESRNIASTRPEPMRARMIHPLNETASSWRKPSCERRASTSACTAASPRGTSSTHASPRELAITKAPSKIPPGSAPRRRSSSMVQPPRTTAASEPRTEREKEHEADHEPAYVGALPLPAERQGHPDARRGHEQEVEPPSQADTRKIRRPRSGPA